MSELQEEKEDMKSAFAEFDIWDERDSDKLMQMQLAASKLKERYIRGAFSSLLIPRVNRHFMQWQVARAFTIEHTMLQFRLADEFEVLEAPDVLALSNKNKAAESMTTIGESSAAVEEKKDDEAMVFEESKQLDTVPNIGKSGISDTFSIQIDHNYINGVSPVLDIVRTPSNEDMMMERKDSDTAELEFDDDFLIDQSIATTVIG